MTEPTTTPFRVLMDRLETTSDEASSLSIPADWMQGRTTYGGLTAAISLAAVERANPGLPPLRSAMVSFIGPAGGDVRVAHEILRRGKSAVFANADLHAEKGIAARSTFTFGAARASVFDRDFIETPDVPGPDEAENFFPRDGVGPAFTKHFDVRLAKGARPVSGSSEHDHFLWVRFRDAPPAGMVSLLALADMPPPAMLPMFTEFAPVSSITWMVNFLVDEPATEEGWWLLQSRAEHAREGYSSQDMFIWNADMKPVVAGRQSVAIFA
ncbi:MAG: thioesterase family protein [Alphaproteobacteria bacterium]|nr:thioesterase family protein [Alphaproteobacteria bacterium]